MELLIGIIVFFVIVCIFAFVNGIISEKKHEERKAKAIIEQEKHAKERAKEQAEIQSQWAERVAQYGEPTIIFDIYLNPNRNIAIYEPMNIIFINGKKYDFKDILSCRIETISKVTKGAETHITKPDSGEMAMEQLLWGMGKKYNVKSTTRVIKEPDKVSKTHIVYIGVNDLAEPQHKLTFYSSENANKLLSAINIIIERNKQV